METMLTISKGWTAVTLTEACAVAGGIDKGAQEAIYMFGYLLGVVAKAATKVYLYIKGIF